MEKITYELYAKPGDFISDESARLFAYYSECAHQLRLENYINNHERWIELVVYIHTPHDRERYVTLYKEFICHPERSEWYAKHN